MNITVNKTATPKTKPADETELGFGRIFSDHMFIMDYEKGKGWHNAGIQPFGDITVSPAAMVLHYAQEVFEGLKAYRTPENRIQLFRPEENFKRMNISCKRAVIPEFDSDFALNALKELIKTDADWVPRTDGASLYIRPFIFAADPFVGVRPSETYKFIIITSPSGAYYATGLNPTSIYVEEKYVRAVRGGMGFIKTGGNYAASLLGQHEAHEQHFDQVLWLDGVERRYIEEVGSMNVFFVIGDEIVTPELNGSILPGITRMSVIELCRKWGLKVAERKLDADGIFDSHDKGELKEVFGTGTAAVISPVGVLRRGGRTIRVNEGRIGAVSQKLYDALTGIQYGRIADDMGWTVTVDS